MNTGENTPENWLDPSTWRSTLPAGVVMRPGGGDTPYREGVPLTMARLIAVPAVLDAITTPPPEPLLTKLANAKRPPGWFHR